MDKIKSILLDVEDIIIFNIFLVPILSAIYLLWKIESTRKLFVIVTAIAVSIAIISITIVIVIKTIPFQSKSSPKKTINAVNFTQKATYIKKDYQIADIGIINTFYCDWYLENLGRITKVEIIIINDSSSNIKVYGENSENSIFEFTYAGCASLDQVLDIIQKKTIF